MSPRLSSQAIRCFGVLLAFTLHPTAPGIAQTKSYRALASRFCLDCHGSQDAEAGFDLETLLQKPFRAHTDDWERVLQKLETGQMPPKTSPVPNQTERDAAIADLVDELDAAAFTSPNPGTATALKRLNRTEYQNAIRDLLDLEIDARDYLPPDESSNGFDHTLTNNLSPTLLSRYLVAAKKIAHLAVGRPVKSPVGKTFRIKPDVTQEKHVLGLPLGTRGGGRFLHHFPQTGLYEFQIRLARDRNDEVEGLRGSHDLLILIDNEQVASLKISRPKSGTLADFQDSNLRTRLPIVAGPHEVSATFRRTSGSLSESVRQPLNVRFNLHRHPRLVPAVYELSITGPFAGANVTEHRLPSTPTLTPSQKTIFVARPGSNASSETAAKQVLEKLGRKAYRRELKPEDMHRLLDFFRSGDDQHGYESGIESAITAILTSPHFLFKIPPSDLAVMTDDDLKERGTRRISDYELASSLSFFLWSSLPDELLLHLASENRLHEPAELARQVKRMLADPRASNLTSNFASQWLHLRNLGSITPDGRKFPDFDENLRLAMRRETELHFESMVTNNASVLDLIQSEHTYLNERLAKHYGIPGVHGSRYRRVNLLPHHHRGGILRQGSILTLTSYATRTSPVVRGNWVLKNILGATIPPPPDDVPGLEEQPSLVDSSSVRERLLQHRSDSACASCHELMDPIGFALENYDAVGRWRDRDHGLPILTTGMLPSGVAFKSLDDIEDTLMSHPELFVSTFSERLLTFALGRGTELHDRPAIRKIVRDAKPTGYRIESIVLGIINSVPFQLRSSP